MIDPIWYLRGLEGVVLVVGSTIAYQSLRAYIRDRRASLAYLGAGFILISLAAALAGVVFEVTTHNLLAAWIVSAAFDSAGFLVILYSIVRPLSKGLPGPRASGSPSDREGGTDDDPSGRGAPLGDPAGTPAPSVEGRSNPTRTTQDAPADLPREA